MSYGLTSTGFVIKDLQTIKLELETDYKAAFGSDLDVSESSVAGQFIGNLSIKLANVWEILAAVYASFNPDTASGVSLDGAVALVGVERIPGIHTTVYELIYGDQSAVIPAGHLIAQDNGTQFELIAATTIGLNNWGDITLYYNNNVSVGTSYYIYINGTSYHYTAVGGDTLLVVLTHLASLITTGETYVEAAAYHVGTIPGNPAEKLHIYSTDGIHSFMVGAYKDGFYIDPDIPLAAIGIYQSVEVGAISVAINTVTKIVQLVSGLSSVTNWAQGILGRNTETDDTLRARRRLALAGTAYATEEALRTRILQEVDDVSYCTVISNRTDSTVDSQPAHSFMVVVEGGTDAAIAEKIWEIMPAGIATYGNTSYTITDSQGDSQLIYFSRPTLKYIWVQGTLTVNNIDIFPPTAITLVAEYIAAWAASNITVGDDVIWQRLYSPIYQIPGLGDATFEIGVSDAPGTPPVSYAAANIVITNTQLALFDVSRIAFTEV